MPPAYDEFVEFIARGTTAEGLIAFRPSEAARARVLDLINRQKGASLAPEETTELNQCLMIEHLMRLAKARARKRLSR